MRYLLCGLGFLALVACEPTIPDSGAGVGFGSYSEYQKKQAEREAKLTGSALPAPTAVSSVPLGAAPLPASGTGDTTEQLAADTAAALNSGRTPVDASPSNPPPVVVNNSGISGENNFERVAEARSIESDAALIAQNRANYQQVAPTAVPSRSGRAEPNIVDFALKSSNPVGTAVYRRLTIGAASRSARGCAKYASPDLAQEDFLLKGGPEKDRLGLDPDGDGYACSWDPAPFRLARGG